jgi:hypothetical protein
MSFAAFRGNPKTYLKSHSMSIGGLNAAVNAAMNAAVAVALPLPTHGHREEWTHLGPLSFIQTLPIGGREGRAGSGVLRRIGGALRVGNPYKQNNFIPIGVADAGLRYLPYRADHCTYMEMDGAGEFFMTGPLQGCAVAAGRHPGTNNVWCFHANANGVAGGGNAAAKQQMIFETAAHVGIPVGNLRFCEYASVPSNNHYFGLGFVWGRRRGGGAWKFYVHWIAPGGGSENSRWAEI